MTAAIKRRLAALEVRLGTNDSQAFPTEIWIVAAGDPEHKALLWKAATQGCEASTGELAERMGRPVNEVRESVARFREARKKVIEEDDC